ncbi:two-component sensor histidine kinase [Listeria weihenstephanensis]|uniref:histidine kinase n=1 Tax=Listeria weihenstephanensis TaxID=1006155 RepID=A0A841Z3R2_9LIST|nr:HAMP domain-containing sensor histidine kinase [Listeria weihenstephanensis]MBC1499087.1 two-component sensor histidine kinase [Listeria weihenstephanensis]
MVKKLKAIGSSCMVGVFFILSNLASYTTFTWLKGVYNFSWPTIWEQATIAAGGLTLMVLIGFILSRFFFRHERAYFKIFGAVLEEIGRGNFQISEQLRPLQRMDDGNIRDTVLQVEKMAEQLGEMETMRQDFIANVSHEIQSPLTSISGFTKLLQDNSLTAEKRTHYLEIIQAETSRLSKISENLLKLTALEKNDYQLNPTEFRLDYQIRDMILTAEPQWQTKNLDVIVDLAPTKFYGDESLLYQVWQNLFHNAIKFTPENGTIHVTLSQNKEGQNEVTFQDSGIGISEEDQLRIFERFYKADLSRQAKIGGSGLGLSIVKRIADLHEMTIKVSSSEGQGSKIMLQLPNK